MRKPMTGMLTVSILVLTGCACVQPRAYDQNQTQQQAEPQPQAQRQPQRAVTPDNIAVQDYMAPCCGALRIEKQLPETVNLNQPFEYTITATNLTDQTLRDVIIREQLAEGLEFHIPRGYLYFAMAFSLAVEMLNLKVRKARAPVVLHRHVGKGDAH